MRIQLVSFAATVAVFACAGGSQGGGGAAAPAAATGATSRRQGNVITSEEIAKSSGSTALDVVRQLRSQWLITRGVAGANDPGAGGIMVYVDGVRRGGLESLEQIGVEQLGQIRFLDANNATTRYGTGHPNGAIEITTKR